MFDKPYRPMEAGEDLQGNSQLWWNKNPMSYDWYGTNQSTEGTKEFFEETDRRFFNSSPLYRGQKPFGSLIPFNHLNGKRVLEIGCGLGSHSQLLAETGCNLSAIDLTPRAVSLTARRLANAGLSADVREMDAEEMDLPDAEFDFVWSWGVIHHSAHTDRIVREVTRVLKPGGEFRLMVYNRHAFDSYTKILRGILTGKFLRGMSPDDILSYYTDGYLARFYSHATLTTLLEENGLQVERISVLGQTSELVPLPGKGTVGRLKYAIVNRIPHALAEPALRITGSFLFGIAKKPAHVLGTLLP